MSDLDSIRYGVVIDAGSSGSRIYVFRWNDPNILLKNSDDAVLLHSVPQIIQDKDWSSKVSPGLSSYVNSAEKAFSEHIKPLLEFASEIIPKEKIEITPVFIQATAGMRLLRPKERNAIMSNVCHGLVHSTNFLIENCESQIQVIDGETEGLYGWLSLNYLYGHFNNYDLAHKDHFTFGFMDMGGASTQIAFAPSDPLEVSKHRDDIATVRLRSVNGDIQEWNVFVSTWLGFGANEARRRYLIQLINSLPENSNDYKEDDYTTTKVTDPCVPKHCRTTFKYKEKDFEIYGSGNYEQCSKSIYPLLLKNLPCVEEPCLFNGVHAPQIDYYKDKFIGTSEYWYTANDVFKLGGAYNFEEFSAHVEEFCNTDWEVIEKNSKEGLYNALPTEFLIDSCFKANWVLNVLHEGFNLPRAGIDEIKDNEEYDGSENYPLFQSAASVKEKELSWTLGRILIYACSSIEAGDKGIIVGVDPSENSLLTNNVLSDSPVNTTSDKGFSSRLITLFFGFIIIAMWLKFFPKSSRRGWNKLLNIMTIKIRKLKQYNLVCDPQSELEQGTYETNNDEESFAENEDGCKYRSKSMFNLNSQAGNATKFPVRLMGTAISKCGSASAIPTKTLSNSSNTLRPAFSLSDFSKFKDGKFND